MLESSRNIHAFTNYTNFFSTLIISIHQLSARCYLKYLNYRPLNAEFVMEMLTAT